MNEKTPFIFGLPSSRLTKDVISHLQFCRPYGIILFNRNIESVEQTHELCQEIESIIGKTLFSIDYEGAQVTRFPPHILNPPAPQALCSHSLASIREAARIQATTLREWGIQWNFAPSLDLAYYPYNTAINTRSFGRNPQTVGEIGKIIIEEYEKQQVATCLKHFPGHGSVGQDTHLSFAKLTKKERHLETQDWLPFKLVMAKKAPSIMLAHINLLNENLPASLSPNVVSILRKRWGYNGLIITDCIEMQALQKHYSIQEIIQLGLQANVDLWISSFSLCQSLSLQKELVTEYRKCKKNEKKTAQSQIRQQKFHLDYISEPKKINLITKQKLKTTCLNLHKKTILALQEDYSQITLPLTILYTPEEQSKIITSTPAIPQFIDELLQKPALFHSKKAIAFDDLQGLRQFIAECTTSIVWITHNANQNSFFQDWLSILKQKQDIMHLATSQPFDLQGIFPCELASFGLSQYWSAIAFSHKIQRNKLSMKTTCT